MSLGPCAKVVGSATTWSIGPGPPKSYHPVPETIPSIRSSTTLDRVESFLDSHRYSIRLGKKCALGTDGTGKQLAFQNFVAELETMHFSLPPLRPLFHGCTPHTASPWWVSSKNSFVLFSSISHRRGPSIIQISKPSGAGVRRALWMGMPHLPFARISIRRMRY
jgi:hypothetical protein